VTGARDIRRATAREANELTGFVIGGIPPIGHERPVRVIMDPDLGRYETVWAAAGLPTAVFPVPPATLRILANAMVAPITEERRAADVEAERGATAGGLAAGGATAQNAGA
jgi:prolyl-tRNA editing enzyme YbaK/EbsC (Cys-tRNA(Pro) deacylase)